MASGTGFGERVLYFKYKQENDSKAVSVDMHRSVWKKIFTEHFKHIYVGRNHTYLGSKICPMHTYLGVRQLLV